MPILSILGMVLPIVTKIAGVLINRFWTNGYSTLAGTAIGGAIFTELQKFGCDMSQFDKMMLALIPVIYGAVSVDAGKTTQSIPQAVKELITQAQISSDNM